MQHQAGYISYISHITDDLHLSLERWNISCNALGSWIYFYHQDVKIPAQGWKFHISATIFSAEEILQQVLPILVSEPTSFKILASQHWLHYVNQGHAGLSQIGKFITFYPSDDQQALRLVPRLDMATKGMLGPRIPSDQRWKSDSRLFYRYGSFRKQIAQTPTGEFIDCICDPNGAFVKDERGLTFLPPEWAQNPFQNSQTAQSAHLANQQILRDRYLVIAPVYQSIRGPISLAIDVQSAQQCIIKTAKYDILAELPSRTSYEMLRNEAEILGKIAPFIDSPRVYDIFEHNQDLYLVMEYIEGETLKNYLSREIRSCRQLTDRQFLQWSRIIAEKLYQLHTNGIIYRDLKTVNMIVTTAKELRLIDFGVAFDTQAEIQQFHGGTRGYASADQTANKPAKITDDVYSFGALLYALATNTEPAMAPNPKNLLSRPVSALRQRAHPKISQLIAQCLNTEYQSFQPICEYLGSLEQNLTGDNLPIPKIWRQGYRSSQQQRYLAYARATFAAMRIALEQSPEHSKLEWARCCIPGAPDIIVKDVHIGSAGVLFACAQMAERLQQVDESRTLLYTAAQILLQDGDPIYRMGAGGLFIGSAGIGAAILRVGQVLRDNEFIARAEIIGRSLAKTAYDMYDIFGGAAGRLKFHLYLWQVTRNYEHLQNAAQVGKFLLKCAEKDANNAIYWRTPAGYGDISNKCYVGFGHGAAGIADALLDLYDATGTLDFFVGAQKASNWILSQTLSVGADTSLAGWPETENGEASPPFWCHGAGGIGTFFLHAAQSGLTEKALVMAQKAAKAVACGTRSAGPTQCHGLAGSIEFLLDMYQATNNPYWRSQAYALAHMLEAYAVTQDDTQVWFTDEPDTIAPGYLNGFSGIALCLLRLSDCTMPSLRLCSRNI